MSDGSIRQGIDQAALDKYLQQNLPHIDLPLRLRQFGDGQSNPTYLLISPSGQRHVLRKQPPGSLLSGSAHRIDREYMVLKALGSTEVPVPRVLRMCHDASVLGTPFYVMEFLDGRIITDPLLAEIKEEHRYAMWRNAARVLSKIHSTDIEAVGLGTFGSRSSFYKRQSKTFTKISTAQQKVKDPSTGTPIESVPHFKDLVAFYEDVNHAPVQRTSLVHGDYRIGNLMWHKTEPRVIGVLDWELSTIGHPLSDVASLIDPYSRYYFGQKATQHDNPRNDKFGTDGHP
ncbi:uncharacterized protein N7477_005171 [Penicillium maclennaniae]|uniref:uncharacterized protein n=1 Tax=Penicillium maclennaniae TaxID=1343394 RepID=UPI002541FD9F|nr:uncharacterized protein N7477_005171 [Penicillium maclennaniae]KAJ5675237.1 hypothetical protein N7477_005171 [Penicillium maclennaniae]